MRRKLLPIRMPRVQEPKAKTEELLELASVLMHRIVDDAHALELILRKVKARRRARK